MQNSTFKHNNCEIFNLETSEDAFTRRNLQRDTLVPFHEKQPKIPSKNACALNEKTMGGTKQIKWKFERGSEVMKPA
jgi:hypothetical protein